MTERPHADPESFRAALHLIADVLADIAAEHRTPNLVDALPGERHGRNRPTAPERKRRAPRMPPVIHKVVDVTAENRERARQALLRRGYAVRAEEDRP